MSRLQSYVSQIFAPVTITWRNFFSLVAGTNQSSQAKRQRFALINSRVQLVSAVFALLVPLWILIDYLVLPDQWQDIAVYRLIIGGVFLVIASLKTPEPSQLKTWSLLLAVLSMPLLMYIATLGTIASLSADGFSGVIRDLYGFLPFIIVAGLCIFPLTAFEALLFAVPVFLASAWGNWTLHPGLWEDLISTLWLLVLVTATSTFSCISQLQYMSALVQRATRDSLTGALSRQSGSESVELMYLSATATDTPLSVAFLDLDNFKIINDTFGHDEGDKVLCELTKKINDTMRSQDSLVRWGGEEFLLLLSKADKGGARRVLERILKNGFGVRPDGLPITASVGVAECRSDRTFSWSELVELADKRMYQAKAAGRNRVVMGRDESFPGIDVTLAAVPASQQDVS